MRLKEALQFLGKEWRRLDQTFKQYREMNSEIAAKEDAAGRVIYEDENDLDCLRIVAEIFIGRPDYLNPLVVVDKTRNAK